MYIVKGISFPFAGINKNKLSWNIKKKNIWYTKKKIIIDDHFKSQIDNELVYTKMFGYNMKAWNYDTHTHTHIYLL